MSSDGEDDETGYGKPPKHTRWQEGRSGNPKRQYPKRVESTVEFLEQNFTPSPTARRAQACSGVRAHSARKDARWRRKGGTYPLV
jgi:hypothetical protein